MAEELEAALFQFHVPREGGYLLTGFCLHAHAFSREAERLTGASAHQQVYLSHLLSADVAHIAEHDCGREVVQRVVYGELVHLACVVARDGNPHVAQCYLPAAHAVEKT